MQGEGRHGTVSCPPSRGYKDGTQVISLGGKHFYLPPDSFYQPLKFLLHLFICVCWGGVLCVCHGAHMETRRRPIRINHLLQVETELSCQKQLQAPPPAESSQALWFIFKRTFRNNFPKVLAPFYISEAPTCPFLIGCYKLQEGCQH